VRDAASPRTTEIVQEALGLLEREGPDGLTMRALADRLQIKAPSLYKHLDDKEELEAMLIAESFRAMGDALHQAVDELPARTSKRKALGELARVYRAWALAHPHLYRLATEGELPRDRLPEGLEAWTAEPLVRIAGGEHEARAAWAFAHGMTILELDGRFPGGADLDAAWDAGIAALGA
jgi:AcrR family transcriptional regulator